MFFSLHSLFFFLDAWECGYIRKTKTLNAEPEYHFYLIPVVIKISKFVQFKRLGLPLKAVSKIFDASTMNFQHLLHMSAPEQHVLTSS